MFVNQGVNATRKTSIAIALLVLIDSCIVGASIGRRIAIITHVQMASVIIAIIIVEFQILVETFEDGLRVILWSVVHI